jgi:transcriptional regulator with XRE-family HTH domain
MKKKSFRELFTEAERDPIFWTERAILRATEEIFLAMERKGISRAELARRLDSSPAYVTKVLRGNANFTLETLARIAYALEGEFKFHISPREMRTRWFDVSTPVDRTLEAPKTTVTLHGSGLNPAREWSMPANSAGWVHLSKGDSEQRGKVQENAAAAA